MWGQVLAAWNTYKNDRIIPTRVGTRIPNNCVPSLLQDHPHACGDKNHPQMRSAVARGSSPRVWGQADDERRYIANDGIIPTRVGTRHLIQPSSACCRDHPHACGDKIKSISTVCTTTGSSPRVWGQGSFYGCGYSIRGIIPTRVGTS